VVREDQKVMLRAFARAIDRETHVLSAEPGLLWQQLYNRLQWDPAPVPNILANEFAQRTASSARPWLHTRVPFRESTALIRTLSGHNKPVQTCAISVDGRLAVSASEDGTLIIWNAIEGLPQSTLSGHLGPIHSCAISSDSSFIVTAGEDQTLIIWDTVSGAPRVTLRGHREPVHACAISPDNRLIASGGQDGNLRVWDATTGARKLTLRGHEGAIYACAFSPDGPLVASVGEGKTIYLWDTDRGTVVDRIDVFESRLHGCSFLPDGTDLLVSAPGNKLSVIHLSSSEVVQTFSASTKQHHRFYWGVAGIAGPRGFAIMPDGRSVLSAAPDNSLRIWEANSGQERANLSGHAAVIRCCAVSVNAGIAVSGGEDGTLKVWDLANVTYDTERVSHSEPVQDCAISPDGRLLVATWGDRTASLLDFETLQHIARLQGGDVHACAISADGEWIATAHIGRLINVHSVDVAVHREAGGQKYHDARTVDGAPPIAYSLSEEIPQVVDYASIIIDACTFDRTGQIFVCAMADATLTVWDVPKRERIAVLEGHKEAVTDCAVSPDNEFIVSSSSDGTLILWHLPTLRLRQVLRGHRGAVLGCAISPDSKLILSAGEDGVLTLWETATGERLGTLEGHAGAVQACAVSPDGRFVASAGSDAALRVWDLATRRRVAMIALPGGLRSLALHPSRPIAVCGDDGGNLFVVDMMGVAYGPLVPAPEHTTTSPIARPPVAARELSAGAVLCLLMLALLIPLANSLLGRVPPILGTALDRTMLAGLVFAWLLARRIGSGTAPSVDRRPGEVAALAALLVSAPLAPSFALAGERGLRDQLLMTAALGLIAGALDVLARSRRDQMLERLVIGATGAASLPAAYAIGAKVADAVATSPAKIAAGIGVGVVAAAIAFLVFLLTLSGLRRGFRAALNNGIVKLSVATVVFALGGAFAASSLWPLKIGGTMLIGLAFAGLLSKSWASKIIASWWVLGIVLILSYFLLAWLWTAQSLG